MKTTILTGVLLATYSTLALASFPNGNYSGHGFWKDNKGNVGQYNVRVVSSPKSLQNFYDFASGNQKYEMDVTGLDNGFFEVTTAGEKIGDGYCMSVQCHYVATSNSLEESITFWNGHLYRLGSKMVDSTKITWEEDLKLISNK